MGRVCCGGGGNSAVGLHGNTDAFFGLLAGLVFVVWHCANTAEKRCLEIVTWS